MEEIFKVVCELCVVECVVVENSEYVEEEVK